ncbi:MAG TPA: GTP-binding protein, partial [Limnobacter sp.]|nr:GTP-binding protein [Limnobacter sp.]
LNESVSHAADHLRNALGSSVGEVLTTAGDQLVEILEAERGKLLTPATHAPRGDYLAAQKRLTELEGLLESLQQQVNAYREGVDRLGRLQAEQAQDQAERPWEALRRQLDSAVEKLNKARGLASTCEQARLQLEQADIQVAALRGQFDNLEAQEELLRTRQARLLTAKTGFESRQAVMDAAQGRLIEARNAHMKASEMLDLARLADRQKIARESAASLDTQLSRAVENLAKASKLNQDIVELGAASQSLKVDRKNIQHVQKLQAEIANLQTRLDSVATAIEFDLLPGVTASADGQSLQGKVRLNLFAQTEVSIQGVGKMTVLPGGTELTGWVSELKDRQDVLQAMLEDLGVVSLEELETKVNQREALQADLESARAVLAVLAPQGLSHLQAECLALQSQLEQLKHQLADTDTHSAPGNSAGSGTQGLMVLPIHEAELQERSARSAMEVAVEGAQNARMELASAQSTLNEVQVEHDALLQRVQGAEWNLAKATALQKLKDATTRQQDLNAEWQRLRGEVQALNLQVLEQDVKRLEQSVAQAESAYQSRMQQISALEAELQTRGALGQEEQLAQLQLEQVQVSRRVNEFSCRASALTLLLKLLNEKRQELALKLQAPLQKHLQHYLNILWPGTQVELGEDLSIRRIQRNSGSGPEGGSFEELSMGAREQMGIVARLAYADLLKESNRPTLIVLDDALVHSDKDRLVQMKRVLFDAADRHQILLFSCHPEDWADLGVPRRAL